MLNDEKRHTIILQLLFLLKVIQQIPNFFLEFLFPLGKASYFFFTSGPDQSNWCELYPK